MASHRGAILEIEYPKGGRLRSRKVVTRSRARSTGKYPSWKMGRMIQWESPNELNAFRLLDASPDVLSYREQPLAIRYVLCGEERIHYPDILVVRANARELWEVKPAGEAIRERNAERTRLLEAALPNYGFTYRMVVAEDLAAQPRMENVLALLKHGRKAIDVVQREQVRRAFLTSPVIQWHNATNGDLGPNGFASLCRLVLEGVVSVDLGVPLSQGKFQFIDKATGG
jgi:hypothetical protein